MTHPLAAYLRASGDEASDFARRCGVDPAALRAVIAGAPAPSLAFARRVADAAGGAVTLDDLLGGAAPFDPAPCTQADPDPALLEAALGEAWLKRAGAPLDAMVARAGAEAVSDTYAALARVTSRRGADRLAQALRSVLAEILADLGHGRDADRFLDGLVAETNAIYARRR